MSQAGKLTRVNDAYIRLKDEIRTNRMPFGYQATEPEIALRLGMSRTPVREALIRLEAEGLVELIPRRGARVLPIRADDMKEIYEILSALEPEAAAGLAARKPSSDELLPLEEAIEDMEKSLARDDLDAWAQADDKYHHTILELHGNLRLRTFAMALNDQVHRARIVTLRLRDKPDKSNYEHRQILELLRKGDVVNVRRVFRTHRQRAAKELVEILEKFKLGQL